jgi:hypothetical protein
MHIESHRVGTYGLVSIKEASHTHVDPKPQCYGTTFLARPYQTLIVLGFMAQLDSSSNPQVLVMLVKHGRWPEMVPHPNYRCIAKNAS